jgi:hypothetical protein
MPRRDAERNNPRKRKLEELNKPDVSADAII